MKRSNLHEIQTLEVADILNRLDNGYEFVAIHQHTSEMVEDDIVAIQLSVPKEGVAVDLFVKMLAPDKDIKRLISYSPNIIHYFSNCLLMSDELKDFHNFMWNL